MANLNKGELFFKLITVALLTALEEIPVVGAVFKITKKCCQLLRDEHEKFSQEERVVQLEQAAACSPAEAEQAAAAAIAEASAAGQTIDPELAEAIKDVMTVMPAQIRERTRVILEDAQRSGTEAVAALPVTSRFSDTARDAFYSSLFPQRRPQFRKGNAVPNYNSEWKLERLLGAGGFGQVWLVRHERMQSRPPIAVKFCQDEVSAELLRKEADKLDVLPLNMPYVVTLLDCQFTTMPYWLAMEYVEGGTLESRMRLGPMSWPEAWAIFKPLLEGMAHVHKLGIVHRDLKPANILLTKDNVPRIADFGIGKILVTAEAAAMSSARRDSTIAGYGTIGYMSPEQRDGQPAHPTDDVYSLGVLLWQMLAGGLKSLNYPAYINRLDVSNTIKLTLISCVFAPREDRPADAQALLELLTPPPGPLPLTGEGVKTATPPPGPLPLTGEGVKTATPPPGPLPLTGEGVKTATPPPTPVSSSSSLSSHGEGRGGVLVESIHGWSADKVQALQKRTAEFLQSPVEFQHNLKSGGKGPVMVVIPAGSFLMGSPDNEPGRSSDEGPQHEVTLTKPFAMGKFAVTFEDYDRFCEATGNSKPGDQGWGRGRRPVINVSWADAVAYCEWLSEQTGKTYRLPTEAEWEYACRSGTVTPFAWGSTITPKQANYDGNYAYNGGAKGEYRQKTVPVEEFAPNAFGLYQMHGNVWEWTCSGYDAAYSGKETTCANKGNSIARAVRGGSWIDYPGRVRAAYRFYYTPSNRFNDLGFRAVQD